MGFTVNLYDNHSPVNKIGKSLSDEKTISDVLLKNNTSVLRPVLTIKSSDNIFYYNYMYISTFGRYYFIDDVRSVHDNIWEVSAHVDVLETYKTQILANQAVLRRQQNKYNTYLNDPEWKVYAYENVVAHKFSTTPFSKTLQYVLAVAGA